MTSPALANVPRAPAAPGQPGAGAYGSARDAVLTPRQAEYRLFARVTHRLTESSAALREGDRAAYFRLAEAVHDNLRLWLSLALDLSVEANGLPEPLRAQLISLAGFVEKRSALIRARDGDPAALAESLIELNAAVMKGLRGGGEQG